MENDFLATDKFFFTSKKSFSISFPSKYELFNLGPNLLSGPMDEALVLKQGIWLKQMHIDPELSPNVTLSERLLIPYLFSWTKVSPFSLVYLV